MTRAVAWLCVGLAVAAAAAAACDKREPSPEAAEPYRPPPPPLPPPPPDAGVARRTGDEPSLVECIRACRAGVRRARGEGRGARDCVADCSRACTATCVDRAKARGEFSERTEAACAVSCRLGE
ncbi:MAG: hypothetical protein D6689_10690 [Deltaproteobacteria bacterium]|nr:MAG: hypothetical protein D6689_10690 [Deltaproteobacteria bacterium]